MGMSIDKAIKQLDKYTIPCGRYKEAYDFAIETMRKYEKIQKTYERFQKDDDYHPVMAWLDVMAVLEDGSAE